MAHHQRKEEYLTKERLNRAARKGVKEASRRAMETAGSLVIIKDGWVVREHGDGSIQKLSKLEKVSPQAVRKKVKKLARR